MGHSSKRDDRLSQQIRHSAIETFGTVFGDPYRPVRYAIPWISIVFVMALPLPFLGILEAGQRPSPSGLDFSITASFLALALHAGLWTRSVALDDHQAGIPLPFGIRELGIGVAALILLAPPLWLWSQSIGLAHSLDHQIVAIHRLAGWFGHQALSDYGHENVYATGSRAAGFAALIATYVAIRFMPLFAQVSADRQADLTAAWKSTRGGAMVNLLGPMVLTALPFGLLAAATNQLSLCCVDNPAVIGSLEVIGTVALFPMSALAATALGLWCRVHRVV
ncbi:MAG: hypothetical protein AAF556_04915 [Pseudomonadota bacterium]